ncbi:hypothetical protein A3Q56_01304 [Intoshia linei]|uniref:Paired domain-containing protein n=1 Tax=Intoshia linei TaxID=1819745 RepID=A0A177B9J8_9BILA|nr:hypothetical protein A3Q56_01304 [Intoshia linei]
MPQISIEKRKLIVDFYKKGYPQTKITRKLSISRFPVQEIIKKHKNGIPLKNRKRSGRQHVLHSKERRLLIRLFKKDPFMTASDLKSQLPLGANISIDTIKQNLRMGGRFGRVAKKPLCPSVW